MRRIHVQRTLVSLSIAAVLVAGCTAPSAPGTVWIGFVDGSVSVTDQDEHWLAALKARLIDRLDFGDAVIVYGISDRTAERAPLFEGRIPPRGDGMMEEAAARETLESVRSEVEQRVRSFLANVTPSRHTDILSAIRLIPSGSARPVRVLYLSDGLESTETLDLEKTAIVDPPALARRIAELHALRPASLHGVTVSFVLDSPATGVRPRVNSRRALEDLFRALYDDYLGAHIATFDSSTQENDFARVGGAE